MPIQGVSNRLSLKAAEEPTVHHIINGVDANSLKSDTVSWIPAVVGIQMLLQKRLMNILSYVNKCLPKVALSNHACKLLLLEKILRVHG